MQAKFHIATFTHNMLYSLSHLAAGCCKKLDDVTGGPNVFNIAAVYWDEMLRAFGRAFIE